MAIQINFCLLIHVRKYYYMSFLILLFECINAHANIRQAPLCRHFHPNVAIKIGYVKITG